MASRGRGVVKRGYLFDKKGLLDRKRWYVLRQDVTHRSCLLEIFKDEKAAARQEPPKSFINVHDIVEVRRVAERRHSFEVLCPGLGYRFTTHSDVEADEWVLAIRGLILYRRDPGLGAATLPASLHSSSRRHTQPVAITHSHTAPLPPHNTSPHPHSRTHLSSSSLPDSVGLQLSASPSYPLPPNLPTPPDLATSPITHPPPRPMPRQRSAELPPHTSLPCSFPPPPSPPSSSSSSSMASSSNASLEQPPAVAGCEADFEGRFRVQVKEAEGLAVSGAADLVVGDGCLSLHSADTGHLLVTWPIAALRRYGVNNVSLTIVTGRNCATGEGRFQFYSQQSRRLYSCLHAMAVSKAATKTHSLCRMGSEPGEHSAGGSPPSPHYSHIEHSLAPPTTAEDYSRLSLPHEFGRLMRSKVCPPQHHFGSQCGAMSPGPLGGEAREPPPIPPHDRSRSMATSTLC